MTDLTDRVPAEVRAHIAAEGLRDVAHFVERHPLFANQSGRPMTLRYFCTDPRTFAELTSALEGEFRIEGEGGSTYAHVTREFGPVLIDVYRFANTVCERVVTGVETVETVEWRLKPAPAVTERLIAVDVVVEPF